MKTSHMVKTSLFVIICSALLLLAVCPASLNARVVTATTYETGLEDDGNTEIKVVEAYPDRIEASQNYARTGSWSVRTELRYGDTTSVGCRAESSIRNMGIEPIVERGVAKFYGFSVLLDPTNYAYDNNGDIIFQLKQGSSEPSFHLMTDEGQFKYTYHNADHPTNVSAFFATFQTGIWYDFVYEVLPQYSSTGYMKLWYKKATDSVYTLVLDYTGATLLNDQDGYIKWGVYKSTWCNTTTMSTIRVIYHDNVNIATTFAEADPSAGGTPPVDPPPAAPTGLTATAGNTQINLNWADNTETDLDCYKVYLSTTSGGPYNWIATVTVSDYFDTGVTNGTTYYYVVTAVDINNHESVYSSQVSATPQALPVTYYPGSYAVVLGSYYSGSVSSLTANDNNYLVISSQSSGTTRYATTDFTVTGINSGTPSKIDIQVISKSSKSSTTQKIYVYNYATASWEQKNSSSISTSEVTKNISITSGTANYISGGQFKVRTQGSKTNSTSFNLSHELISVKITP